MVLGGGGGVVVHNRQLLWVPLTTMLEIKDTNTWPEACEQVQED